MLNFLKFFLQVGIVNSIYGSLFGRPEKYGVRGFYLDDESVIGGENGLLMPRSTHTAINKFFRHTFVPMPEYDFIIMDVNENSEKTLYKFKQCTKRLIPGGYIVIKNTNCICPHSGFRLIDYIKNFKEYEVLEFPSDGLAIVRLIDPKFKNYNIRPLNAAFWISLGALGGIVAREFLFNQKDKK